LDAGGRDRIDRLLPQVHQRDVGTVVGGVVVGIETGTLGPKRMVVRVQRCGRFGVLDDLTDFLADQVGEHRVALEVDALVSPELGQYVDEIAGGPRRPEALAALCIAQLPADDRRWRPRNTGQRVAGLRTVAGAVALQQGNAIRWL